jgi:hypothetical protein
MAKKLRRKNHVTPDKWHPFICTPAYDGKVDSDYALSMTNMAWKCPIFQVQLTASIVSNGAFIDLARCQFVQKFLTVHTDCTHLFFVDSDLKFPAEAFVGLVRAGLPICAGVYRRRQEKEDYPIKYSENPDIGGLWVEEDQSGYEWLMADRVPTGFLCIRRDIVEEMAADAKKIIVQGDLDSEEIPQLFYTSVLEDGRFIGEDFAFCDDYVKKYGVPIHVYPNIDFVHGGYECNLSEFLERKIEEEEQSGLSAA